MRGVVLGFRIRLWGWILFARGDTGVCEETLLRRRKPLKSQAFRAPIMIVVIMMIIMIMMIIIIVVVVVMIIIQSQGLRQAFREPNQGLGSSIFCWITGRRPAEKERLLTDTKVQQSKRDPSQNCCLRSSIQKLSRGKWIGTLEP